MKLIEINPFEIEFKMLGISILDTIVLYTLAAIGMSVIVNKFYHSIQLSFLLLAHNVKYYCPRVYETLYHLTVKLNLTQPSSKEQVNREQVSREQEVLNDILSKTEGYYDSVKGIFESHIKDISDPQLKNKIDQWYKSMKGLIETQDPSSVKDFKKRISECSDELYKLLDKCH